MKCKLFHNLYMDELKSQLFGPSVKVDGSIVKYVLYWLH